MIRSGFVALFAALAVAAGPAQEEKYDLRKEWKPVVGYKMEWQSEHSQSMKMVVGEQNMQNEDRSSFAGASIVTKCEGEKVTESKFTFSKAVHRQGVEDVPYGFQGKVVIATQDKEGKYSFAREDGEPLSEEEVSAIREATNSKDKKKDEPDGKEAIAPKHPVAAGESWDIDVAAMFAGNEEMAFDPKRSKASGTLKAVEVRDGIKFAKIEISMEVMITKMGPMELDEPIKMTIHGKGEMATGGEVPDGSMEMKNEVNGSSAVKGMPGKISMEMKNSTTMRAKSVK